MSRDLPLTVVNLWGAPSVGKSTAAAGLFNMMKTQGHRVELVTEVAKDLTYSRDWKALENQLYILGQQDHRLRRLVGEVDYVVTDSPLPLGIVYMTPEYADWLSDATLAAYERYDNIDFILKRRKKYDTYGRTQTEGEALALDLQVRDVFRLATDFGSPEAENVWEIDGDAFAPYEAYQRIFGTLPVEASENAIVADAIDCTAAAIAEDLYVKDEP